MFFFVFCFFWGPEAGVPGAEHSGGATHVRGTDHTSTGAGLWVGAGHHHPGSSEGPPGGDPGRWPPHYPSLRPTWHFLPELGNPCAVFLVSLNFKKIHFH